MARELEIVCRALESASIHLAGEDQADSVRQQLTTVVHSPLRTLVENAQKAAERVMTGLRETA